MKHIVSGIQPTGSLNIGTYLGSIKNFVALQEEYQDHHFLLFIADLHAITVPKERLLLRKTIRELAALYLACGLKREHLSLFIQSEIPAHSQMAYLLQCFAYIGELERMTQYKEKAQKQLTGVTAGLFTYPTLMAGDVLLYDAAFVPVGEDQRQHLELTRDLAIRFNNRYGDFFTVPKPLFPKVGARIMSLTDPDKKMSKSDKNVRSSVLLLDDEPTIRRKIMSAITDSDQKIAYDKDKKPGISNLLTLYAGFSNLSIKDAEMKFSDDSYETLKRELADKIVAGLMPIQEKYYTLLKGDELDKILDQGCEFAQQIAQKKIAKMMHKIGLGRKRK